MTRSRGDMVSPNYRILLATLHLIAYCSAGPIPNVTSVDMGSKEGSCALGDVVYLPGDEFPGSTPCEKCTCANGGIQCEKQQCEPRPGCKALHRPDHCCPTYQCECEQEGRVYGNGEKLVDPADPCRVCYCQGGEVVCRRIACFVRNDCTPRPVPGRCCPEYDNCPLRGVTTLAGVTLAPTAVSVMDIDSNPEPTTKDSRWPVITIKEITPVSEIPVMTDVKIKEILPSPSIEVSEYSSSKSPLIPREVTSEKTINSDDTKTDGPSIVEIHAESTETKNIVTKGDATPSKISFPTQDSINSDIFPSVLPSAETPLPTVAPVTTTRASMTEAIPEEEDHNPAFPPLPDDDLSVFSTHVEETNHETSMDFEHGSQDLSGVPAKPKEETLATTSTDTSTREKALDISAESTTIKSDISNTNIAVSKGSPMLNLRSAIPTELLTAPSNMPESLTESNEKTVITETLLLSSSTDSSKIIDTSTTEKYLISDSVTDNPIISSTPFDIATKSPMGSNIEDLSPESKLESLDERERSTTTYIPDISTTTAKPADFSTENTLQSNSDDTRRSTTDASIVSMEPVSIEISSIPIDNLNTNVQEFENVLKDKPSTSEPLTITTDVPEGNTEIITLAKLSPNENENNGFENIETTEFILTSFSSAESATDTVELIKIAGDQEKSSSIIESPERKKNNDLTDLISLVSDVASINDHTEAPTSITSVKSSSISESEELLPVNPAYKSKSNFNQNSITEVPIKTKNSPANKQKIIEIEDDESSITDSPPPNDKIEPTTKRPIIDNVSENEMENRNKTEKKDIEIITQSYVPTINRKPTKVQMKDDIFKLTTESSLLSETNISTEAPFLTESNVSKEQTSSTERSVITTESVKDITDTTSIVQ